MTPDELELTVSRKLIQMYGEHSCDKDAHIQALEDAARQVMQALVTAIDNAKVADARTKALERLLKRLLSDGSPIETAIADLDPKLYAEMVRALAGKGEPPEDPFVCEKPDCRIKRRHRHGTRRSC